MCSVCRFCGGYARPRLLRSLSHTSVLAEWCPQLCSTTTAPKIQGSHEHPARVVPHAKRSMALTSEWRRARATARLLQRLSHKARACGTVPATARRHLQDESGSKRRVNIPHGSLTREFNTGVPHGSPTRQTEHGFGIWTVSRTARGLKVGFHAWVCWCAEVTLYNNQSSAIDLY